ncbi:YihY/virulence factor BrkB family protein [Sphingosinicella xenopeptidilytica]|uniref:YihY/virulence factor BrkB family protein n=1 Tax=Sphingosinicella xenopeptidilytica TaxID=364098 RepID=A0ABW3C494_SPHXN
MATPEQRGAGADGPHALPLRAWREILFRVWQANGTHNLSLMAAGVAFYAFLSFVPLLGALVMSYGLVADPAAVADHMRLIIELVPTEAARLIYEQLLNLTRAAATAKGLGLAIAIGISIFGASRAARAVMTALNVIYEERDTRGIVRGAAVSAILVVGAVLLGIFGLLAASALGFARELAEGLGAVAALLMRIVTWVCAGVFCSFTIAAMYRFAPHRADARWRWLTIGSLLATVMWLVATLGFGVYVAEFGSYQTTYGSLGAVVVLLMWLYVSAYAVLLGGLINAEAERQTACDTTTGAPRPIGRRGAAVADMSVAADIYPAHGHARR